MKTPVHLVCSSGGVRCFSYVGALQALEQSNQQITGVSASSMGSIIGILACTQMSAAEMEQRVLAFKMNKYVKKKWWIGLLSLWKYPFAKYHTPDFKAILTELTGSDPTLGELPIPFSTLALDLRQRQLLTYSSNTHADMRCSEILKIATAVPPIFEPYAVNKRLLVDAGVATESPAWVAAAQSHGKPVVVLKCAKPADETYWNSFPAFIGNLVASAAASNDQFSLDQIGNAIKVEINCGDLKAENFKIKPLKIEKLILEGHTAMKEKLDECNGDFKNLLKVERYSDIYRAADEADAAENNSNSLAKTFVRQTNIRNQVFISYSHKDINWFNRIQSYLQPIEEFQKINVWDDQDILPGQRWRDAIKQALSQTRVAICIVTQNFLSSEFITEEELNYFLQQSEKQAVQLFFVMASSCNFEMTPLSEIQFAHNPAEPLDMLSEAAQNAVLKTITDKLLIAMKD